MGLYEGLFVTILLYGSKTITWKDKEGSGIIRPGLENDGIGKKVYVVFCVGSRIVGQVQIR